MLMLLLLLICISVFPVQLWLCFSEKKLPVKLIPVYYVAVHLSCSLLLAFSTKWFGMPEDNALVGVILLMIGLFLAVGVAIAWIGWGIVHFVQNRRK